MSEGIALLSINDVIRITRMSKSTIYRRMKDGDFPRQLNLGGRCRRWLLRDIQDYIISLR